ncbi:BTBBA protein, partial [Polypterus senegalus]|nr:ankyrin repeat and BTB/POZ domain-containing protein BTBD11-B-like [Polypterus senegalus]MBN3289140.1 BTBBA protein [Polypterus senegalus]
MSCTCKVCTPIYLTEMTTHRKSPVKNFENLTLDSGYGGMAGSCRSSVLSLSPCSLDASACQGENLWMIHGEETLQTNGDGRRDGCQKCLSHEPEGLDAHPKLPTLEYMPWTEDEMFSVMQKCQPSSPVKRSSLVSLLSTYLGRALLRLSKEAQRLSLPIGKCTKYEIQSAAKLVLSWTLSETCMAAGVRALSLYNMSAEEPFTLEKSALCGLAFSVGSFFRWLVDSRVAPRVHEHAAIYLTATLESLLEEVYGRLLASQESNGHLDDKSLERTLSNDAELWGLFQPYQHLTCGKNAYGVPTLPSYLSIYTRGSLGASGQQRGFFRGNELQTLEQNLLTISVGSVAELSDLVISAMYQLQQLGAQSTGRTFQLHFRQGPLSWEPEALHTLYYYTACQQIDWDNPNSEPPKVKLCSDRPYASLPPLVEWIRVCVAYAEHRHSLTVDSNDVQQAARLLLPGVDCEPRPLRVECCLYASKRLEAAAAAQKLKWNLAFRMLSCGRTDLLPAACSLLGPDGINSVNDQGLTPLMYACASGDEAMVQVLLDGGAALDIQVPGNLQKAFCAHPDTRGWTALMFAVAFAHTSVVQLLLDAGADVDGCVDDEEMTESPLQLASAAGHYNMVCLLMERGADPLAGVSCKGTQGASNAFSLAAAHGHRNVLRKLLSQPESQSSEILSLEDMLAEGTEQNEPRGARWSRSKKVRLKALQEAMFHSSEHGFLDITVELRRQEGVPWTLHTWLHTLQTSFTQQRWDLIHWLLEEFGEVREVFSHEMVSIGLPILFEILKDSKSEATVQKLAAVFSRCYGPYPIPAVPDGSLRNKNVKDISFLNCKDKSDLTFLVEGKPFYAHKDLVSSASTRFQKLIAAASSKGQIEIKDMKYTTFQVVMQWLYTGSLEIPHINRTQVLEVLQAANFFCLNPLKRHCEMLCSRMVHPADIVTMYQQAKLFKASELKAFCEGYFLKNMTALLEVNAFQHLLLGSGGSSGEDTMLKDLSRALATRMNAIYQPSSKETTV